MVVAARQKYKGASMIAGAALTARLTWMVEEPTPSLNRYLSHTPPACQSRVTDTGERSVEGC